MTSTGNCDQCHEPGYLYEQEFGGWFCDACTSIADVYSEREQMYERETRRRGHAGHNDPRVDYVEVPA